MLLALLGRYPVRMVDLGLVVDDRAKIETKISAAMEHDVLLVTGGMSMGERDYVPGILKELGAELKITKLRIKPGKPFVFAKMPGGKFVFGLPGNPVSAFVCLENPGFAASDAHGGGSGFAGGAKGAAGQTA